MTRIGPFEVLKPIGEGGKAAVYLAVDAADRHVNTPPCPRRPLSRL